MEIFATTDTVMLLVDEVLEYISGDFGCEMKYSLDAQVANWEAYQRGEIPSAEIHDAELEHGGPIAYVEYLAGVMRDSGGWVGPPLRVEFYEDLLYVMNGHHRFAASVMLGWNTIPATVDY